jgi:hypothetical protein
VDEQLATVNKAQVMPCARAQRFQDLDYLISIDVAGDVMGSSRLQVWRREGAAEGYFSQSREEFYSH